MAKIKLTKGELKRQRDSLKQYQHYLPTLQLKKQQLQMKILEIRKVLQAKGNELQVKEVEINHWVGLLADPIIYHFQEDVDTSEEMAKDEDRHYFHLQRLVCPEEIITGNINIAGANIPVFKEIKFIEPDYDFYLIPFWVDRGIKELREYFSLVVEIGIIEKQVETLEKELRVTTQRVNLFEKIKIPECMNNIRVIRIYLGDQQANAVGISKVAKKKIEVRALEEVAA